jgi:hypothetical protein
MKAYENADNGDSVNLPRLGKLCVLIPRPELVAILIPPWLGPIQVIHGWKSGAAGVAPRLWAGDRTSRSKTILFWSLEDQANSRVSALGVA